jgi:predicted glycogen debranching enzyme
MRLYGEQVGFVMDRKTLADVFYPVEKRRGYEASGDLWSPGCFQVELTRDKAATLVASTESWETIQALTSEEACAAERRRRHDLLAMAAPEAQCSPAADLVFAADQFIIHPAGRVEDTARARAVGDEVRSVIAGYHWFTDWGRDTMISLEGLTLATGRHLEAGYILRTFDDYIRDGLVPNLFPEPTRHSGTSTPSTAIWRRPAIAAPSGICYRTCAASSRPTCAASGLASPWTRAMACCGRARKAIS